MISLQIISNFIFKKKKKLYVYSKFQLFAKRLEIFLINEKTRTHNLYKNLKLTLFSQ
jgi:hypothetical protein